MGVITQCKGVQHINPKRDDVINMQSIMLKLYVENNVETYMFIPPKFSWNRKGNILGLRPIIKWLKEMFVTKVWRGLYQNINYCLFSIPQICRSIHKICCSIRKICGGICKICYTGMCKICYIVGVVVVGVRN